MPLTAGEMVVHERFFELYDRMLGSDISVPHVLEHVSKVVCEVAQAERASIFLIRRETHELQSVAVVGNVPQTIRIPIKPSSLAGYCALTGKSFIIDDAYGDLSHVDPNLHFDRSWDQLNDFRTKNVLCSPASFQGEILGVCQALNCRTGKFQEKELKALQSIGRLVGYSLYHAKLYEELANMHRLDKEKAKFMRLMVHELKSPLAAACMLMDVVDDELTGKDAETEELVGRVRKRLDDLLALIQTMLGYSRVKSGEPLGEIKPVALGPELLDCCESYRERANRKGIELLVETPDEPLTVRIDIAGLKMIMSNLLSNAVKYTEEGRVVASLTPDNGFARLTVADTGFGIPTDEIPLLFDEFYRATNARQAKLEGSGVGLSGAKALAERFGGRIGFDSVEGEGSTFTVDLPLHRDDTV